MPRYMVRIIIATLIILPVSSALLWWGVFHTLIRYDHIVVVENSTLEIVERSDGNEHLRGQLLFEKEVNLPIKSILAKNQYVITIRTPVNVMPVVFLRAESKDSDRLYKLNGPYIKEIAPNSALGLDGYQYSFSIDDANGAPIKFGIIDEDGTIIDHVEISYERFVIGYVWAIDAL